MAKKRDRLEVIFSILSIIRDNHNSIRSTPLLRKSNLSSLRFSEYISELLAKDFIKEIYDKQDIKFYTLSDKGFTFLERYNSLRAFITDFDL